MQYAATAYVERLQKLNVTLRMAAIGEPRENGYAERLMRTIKEEEVDLSEYHDFADAQRQIRRFLDDVYNIKGEGQSYVNVGCEKHVAILPSGRGYLPHLLTNRNFLEPNVLPIQGL